ncbi:MAG: flagellar basal-body MS-ring/collar protein FliF [Treponema sp.]|nr:flagellar basal-body MS-ring/collar protein FliF [Treponema sp.]MEE3434234.1 flagellar basal-body MS-ring/collar protein FliF [Treponema sp.]
MMNEWLKKLGESAKAAWAKWSKIQKGIVIGIAIAIIVAVAALFRVSSTPTTVRLFNAPVTGDMQSQILTRLDQENVEATVNDAGYISVPDEKTAIKMREILISEGLVPAVVDPWASFFDRGWSTTDADQNQKKKIAIERALTQHVQAVEEVASADVRLSLPEDKLFASEQDPVKASVIIRAKPMSDLYSNRRKILGIQRLIMSAVEGLTAENCVITDSEGNILNDFEGMAESDRLDLVKKQEKLIREGEAHYRAQILKALQNTLSADRVRDLNIKISMDFSKETKDSTVYHPITIREDNPDTPYDDSEFRDTLPISQQTVTREWQGTGFNPQGPAGTEGQNPPTYADMSNVIGKQTETGVTQNNALNTDQIHREESPRYNKVTVSVNIDGIWTKKYDKNHNPVFNETGGIERDYAPVPKEQLEQWADYIQSAIGYDRAKGYKVTVTNIPFDRSAEFEAEDAAILKARQTRLTIILVLIGLAAILAIFILYRFISREMERRRRLREEELLRKQQAARDQALWEAKEEGVEVTMSVEERKRAELQENAIAMAKEHPEDVAMLIRTWLMEE